MKTVISNLHLEIFDPPRLKLWQQLKPFAQLGVLGGGTALALQVGHRQSFDFDIFLNTPIPSMLFKQVQQVFKGQTVRLLLQQSSQLEVIIGQEVHLTFFYSEFPPLHPVIKAEPIPLFAISDLATNKALTIGMRGTWRDYVDLFWLLSQGEIKLEDLIDEAERRFESGFAHKLFLEQLVYWEDIEDFSVQFIGRPIPKEEIQNYFRHLVKQAVAL